MIPCDAYSSCKLYRFWLKVLMGRNGAGDTTSSSNIGEEYRTPKGGRRYVRLHVKSPRSPLHALPTTESTIAAQERQGQSGHDGSIHAATALWEFWLQTRGFGLALTPGHSISASQRPPSSKCSLRQKCNRELTYRNYWQHAVSFAVREEAERHVTESEIRA